VSNIGDEEIRVFKSRALAPRAWPQVMLAGDGVAATFFLKLAYQSENYRAYLLFWVKDWFQIVNKHCSIDHKMSRKSDKFETKQLYDGSD
jgi:hypothetical protein